MASNLLPPTVVGPLSVLNSSVTVVGALEGATVALFQNGSSLNRTAVADGNGVAIVKLQGLELTPAFGVTATQSDNSGTSDPSYPPEPVMPVPSQLSPPAFVSLVHESMDWVLVAGVVPFADVRLDYQGNLVGHVMASDVGVTAPYVDPNSPKVGDQISVRQRIIWQQKTIESLATPSLQVAPAPLEDRKVPPPFITGFLYECETGVPVAGVLDGVNVQLESQHLNATIAFAGNSMWCYTKPLTAKDQVTARQFFVRPKLSSLPSSPPAWVGNYVPPPPNIYGPLCIDTPRVVIDNLLPGSKLELFAGRVGGKTLETAGPWRASVKAVIQTFPLPSPAELRGSMSGPPEFLFARQVNCKAVHGPESAREPFIQLPPPSPPAIGPLYECARLVRVASLMPGRSVVLTSNRPEWPLLSAPTVASDTHVDIGTYRPLWANEKVTATVSPCGSGQGSAATTQVLPLGDLQPPAVRNPTFQWQTTVFVENCTPGARVWVYVNGKYRNAADAVAGTVEVPVGSLLGGGIITAIQTLCTQISKESPAVPAIPGWIGLVAQSPPLIITGPGLQMVEIDAYDAFYNSQKISNGQVVNSNTKQVIGPTGQQFGKSFPYLYNWMNEPFEILAPGYNLWPGPGFFAAKDAAPQAAFTYTPQNPGFHPVIAFFDQSHGAISQWDWDFGDSSPHGNTLNPKHAYTIAGLITVKLTVAGPGGSSSTQRNIGLPFPSQQPQTDPTAESIEMFFCPVDIDFPQAGKHNALYIYVEDLTQQQGFGQPAKLQHGYVGNLCPVQGSPSHTINLADGHRYHIVCVDPDNCGGQNDPNNSACVRWDLVVMGKKGSGALKVVEQ